MTIAQALKEKNRILSSIKKIKSRINSHNQIIKGDVRPYDICELYDDLIKEQQKLVNIKTEIHLASEPVRFFIFKQSELKDLLVFLKSIPNQRGTKSDRYSGTPYEVDSEFDTVKVDQLCESLESQIIEIQDKLDNFNHNTEVNF